MRLEPCFPVCKHGACVLVAASSRGGGKQAGCTGPAASGLLIAQLVARGGLWPLIKGCLEQPVQRQVPSSPGSQLKPAPGKPVWWGWVDSAMSQEAGRSQPKATLVW